MKRGIRVLALLCCAAALMHFSGCGRAAALLNSNGNEYRNTTVTAQAELVDGEEVTAVLGELADGTFTSWDQSVSFKTDESVEKGDVLEVTYDENGSVSGVEIALPAAA